MKAVRQILPYLRGRWGYIAGYGISNLLSVIFSTITVTMISPFLKMLFDQVSPVTENPGLQLNSKEGIMNFFSYYMTELIAQHDNDKSYGLLFICVIVVCTTLLKNIFLYLSRYILNPLRNQVLYRIRNDIFKKVTELPVSFFTNERKGDLISRMTNDVTAIEVSILSTMELLFSTPFTILFYFVVLSYINWKLFLFLLILLPLAGLLIGRISKRLKRPTKETQERQGNLVAIMEETISGLRIVKAFRAEKNRMAAFDHENATLHQLNNTVASRREMASPTSEFLGILILSVVIWFGGNMALKTPPEIDPGMFIVFISMFYFLINPLKSLSQLFYNLHQGGASIERINKILEADNIIHEIDKPIVLNEFKQEIEFKNVSFGYEGNTVLKNISLRIPKGSTVAVVGASGAGKSTLADLLPRFHDTVSGEVLIDGTNIRNYSISSLRDQMGIVSQEPILFNDTVANNIMLGSEVKDTARMEQAARIANVADFVSQKEEGYEHVIGDRGAKLSGGEKQRLTIARALYKNPPILILDEATSSLDTVSERQVQDAINQLMKNRTSIVIAHRLSTVQHANEIIVLDQGEIKERGTHTDLLAQGGLYKKLVDMQLLGE
jgi:subfamily B ATP-binding cassette protein MsbA